MLKMQVVGLSIGMLLGAICNVSVYIYMCATTDWNGVVREALKRSGRNAEQSEMLIQENVARNHAQEEMDARNGDA